MKLPSQEFLEALERDIAITTDVIFALRLATEDEAPAKPLAECCEIMGRLVAHRQVLKLVLAES